MTTDRRLIEDYLPIREISAEASREKSIRHGHISTLHLWWARRPLVASRAAVFGALVPAPETPEERQTLQDEVIQLCQWKVSDEVVARARERIRDDHGGQAPKVLDMFAGGGAIPLEALRLGCEAYALDLNPVAHLIELCTLVYPQQYGPQLAKDVEKWGEWVLKQVKAEIGDLYPPIPDPAASELEPASEQLILPGTEPDVKQLQLKGKMLNPVAYLWTRTVRCPNPACGATVPLVRQTWLAKGKNYYAALKMQADRNTSRVKFKVVEATSRKDLGFDPAGFSSRGNATCPFCGATASSNYVKGEGKMGRIGNQPMAVVCTREGTRDKLYLGVDDAPDYIWPSDSSISERIQALSTETGIAILDEVVESNPRSMDIQRYGLYRWNDLFIPRQTLTLLTFVKFTLEAHQEMLNNGLNEERAKAVTTYLAIALDKMAVRHNSLCHWATTSAGGRLTVAFGRQALAMVWDYAEALPFSGASGDYSLILRDTTNLIRTLGVNDSPGAATRSSATKLPYKSSFFDAVITDPPYYDNVSYSNLSDFFYVWLKRSVGHLYPEHFSTTLTPKKKEIIAATYRHDGDTTEASSFYEKMMVQSLAEARRVLKPGKPLVMVYAHKTTTGWATAVDALRMAGFVITEAWPLNTEMMGHLKKGLAALASSIFLVARRREGEEVGDYVRDVRPLLAKIVRERVETLMAEGISGADLVIATVGAGLRAYTQYARVELASGQELDAAAYLDEVQQEVAEVILEKVMGVDQRGVGGVDFRTRYYTMGRYQYGPTQVPFDEANVLARGVGVELDAPGGLTSGRNPLVEKKKDKVCLRDYRERGEDEDMGLPHNGAKVPLIDVLHRLLWLAEHAPLEVPQFLTLAQPDVAQLRLVAQALAGRALAAEPTPGAMRDTRSAEQGAIDRLLAAWKRVVEENLFVR
jgi:putative DNA methylase